MKILFCALVKKSPQVLPECTMHKRTGCRSFSDVDARHVRLELVGVRDTLKHALLAHAKLVCTHGALVADLATKR